MNSSAAYIFIYLFSNCHMTCSGPLMQPDVKKCSFCSETSEKLPDLESIRSIFTLMEDQE